MIESGFRRSIAAAFAITGLGLLTLEHWGHFSGRDILLSALIGVAVLFLIAYPCRPSAGKAPHDEGS